MRHAMQRVTMEEDKDDVGVFILREWRCVLWLIGDNCVGIVLLLYRMLRDVLFRRRLVDGGTYFQGMMRKSHRVWLSRCLAAAAAVVDGEEEEEEAVVAAAVHSATEMSLVQR